MGFYRQLDMLVTVLTTVLVFAGCTFFIGLSVKTSLVIGAGVFLAGLCFGRAIVKILECF